MKHTPDDKKEALRVLYRRLHGGAFAFDDVDFDDDHADEAGLATEIAVGASVEGTLDYMFDFDYFTFQAEEDQKCLLSVDHRTLRVSNIMLYAPDGVTPLHSKSHGLPPREAIPFNPHEFIDRNEWNSRIRESSIPQIRWVAPGSGTYYLAVHNFGGKTGPYTITITAVAPIEDDYGDTIETATSISLGQVVHATVDDAFDFDYFMFRATEGKNYRILITGGSLEYFRYHLYTADGVPHDDWEYGYRSDGVWGHAADTEWRPSISGPFYLAIDGAYGSVGTYTVTITAVDDDSDS